MTVTADKEIDIEKDFLVFTRHKNGTLRSFSWDSAEKTDAETMKKRIERASQEGHDFTYELITEKLAREVCAYREYARPLEDLIDLVKDARESIGETIQAIRDAGEYLNDAERILDKIEGVD